MIVEGLSSSCAYRMDSRLHGNDGAEFWQL
jgi:hypothetical protein